MRNVQCGTAGDRGTGGRQLANRHLAKFHPRQKKCCAMYCRTDRSPSFIRVIPCDKYNLKEPHWQKTIIHLINGRKNWQRKKRKKKNNSANRIKKAPSQREMPTTLRMRNSITDHSSCSWTGATIPGLLPMLRQDAFHTARRSCTEINQPTVISLCSFLTLYMI